MNTLPTTRLSAFASIVHDLRNPLAVIHGGAEMLVGSMLSPTQAHRIARNIYAASVSMRQFLQELLDEPGVPRKIPNLPMFTNWPPAQWRRWRSLTNCRVFASCASYPRA